MTIIRQFVTRGVCINNKKVLLVRMKNENHFFLPGGRVEENEGFEEALVREIKEELNKEVIICKFLGAIENHFFKKNNQEYYEINNFFLIKIKEIDFENPVSNEDELFFKWVNIEELDQINIKPRSVIKLINKTFLEEKDCFWASNLSNNYL